MYFTKNRKLSNPYFNPFAKWEGTTSVEIYANCHPRNERLQLNSHNSPPSISARNSLLFIRSSLPLQAAGGAELPTIRHTTHQFTFDELPSKNK
ncbi:hypothetical protein CDAR_32741 [Caerostris darwini]|uniref:Uncharacterized protein n=1 Tax=Caerostris darwini TaxID=1538125 RepID=A0AAV4QS16_9ARAC|nr:hypothetical protein CDAR_32741 [Caerostris darwini]